MTVPFAALGMRFFRFVSSLLDTKKVALHVADQHRIEALFCYSRKAPEQNDIRWIAVKIRAPRIEAGNVQRNGFVHRSNPAGHGSTIPQRHFPNNISG